MLLTIDAGNTNIVFAIFKDENLLQKWRLNTNSRTADEYGLTITQLIKLSDINLKEIDSAIISSVVPSVTGPLKELCKKFFNCRNLIVLSEGDNQIPIKIISDKRSEIGDDRLLNVFASHKRFGGKLIVVDLGTATTFDIVNENGEYIGGIISPGVNLANDALSQVAARLPKISVEIPEVLIGNSTITAMKSGIYYGYVGLIEGIVSRIKKELGSNYKLILTGGIAAIFFEEFDCFYLPDLTLEGLMLTYKAIMKKENV